MPVALLALTISAFAIGTTEFVIVGLIPTIAADLAVTLPSAGLLVSLYALSVAIGAPLLTALTRSRCCATARAGRIALIEELAAMRDAGVQHIGLHLRRNRRPLDETLAEIAAEVLPAFHAQADASVA
ncbi:hypothetical protein WI80_33145 [Burkholderia ubonensis]|nr:hypothetical protein WI80_33145 [Burkholderia ubonensis]KVT07224.1 hypothetical protein WK46_11775 [Burkholderia ubonensis]KVT12683.1 hypothetical protein WK47_03765 [Burkholderia ubonensis]KVT24739.1 hypothetical protein WK50_16515 [Burkholderia ubonensis]KVU22128.1 hypothetical protein WK63_32275 [Burkholderia ubonensis]